MTARLFCKTGELAGTEFFIDKEAAIGQNASNQIVLTPSVISGNHARVFFDENLSCYFLEDLKSRNGTKLDGMRVVDRERLGTLHVITFSDSHDFIFQVLSRQVAGTVEVPRPAAPVAHPRTVAESDVPLIAPPLQPAAVRSKTVLDAELPQIPQMQVGSQGKGKTQMETDLPSLPPALEKGVPPISPGEVKRKTVLDQEIPAVPKFSSPAKQVPQPPQVHEDFAPTIQRPTPSVPAKPPAPQPPSVHEGFAPTIQQPASSMPAKHQAAQPPQPASVPEDFAPTIQQPVAPAPAKQQTYVLFLEKENRNIKLQEGENFVGRKKQLAIFIDHTTVSRRHAVLRLKSGKVTVEDLGSSNHTFVDGRQIQSEEEIGSHNKIRFGSVDARLILQ